MTDRCQYSKKLLVNRKTKFVIWDYKKINLRLSIWKHPLEVFCKKNILTLLKGDSNMILFCEICEIFKNVYFEEDLRTTASKYMELTQIQISH